MRSYVALVIGLAWLASHRSALAQPAASLGAPVPAAALGRPTAPIATVSYQPTFRASSPDPLVGDYIPAARLGPISEVRFGPDPSPSMTSTPEERYNWGIRDSAPAPPVRAQPAYSRSLFGEKVGEMFNGNGGGQGFDWGHFESDHCFDDFISPVTNPFLAEDPRALTELRPIFIYQTIPSSNILYHGGNVEYFGLQVRLAITQRLSIVMNKLGGISINPGSDSFVGSSTGFSEFWIGPKYTWYRDDQTGTLSAAGLTFQIPTGPANVFQSTGSLSLAPYVNFAQRFGKTSWGGFSVMDTLGASFSTNSQRSNYFYNSLHVDFDIANAHYVYPLIELNWLQYSSNGSSSPFGFEGQDLANVGSAAAGHDLLSIAFGSRFKVSEAIQFGLAASFPLVGNRDFQNFRLTVDMIWRY